MKTLYTRSNNGLTLVEVIIGVMIFSLLTIAVAAFARNVFYFNSVSTEILSTEQDARKVLRPMVAEIRSASPSSVGGYAIEEASTTYFIFYSDINNDGLKERLRYFKNGTYLDRGIVSPSGSPSSYNLASEQTSHLIKGLIATSTPIFTYYDTNYTGTTSALSFPVDISNLRLVKISINIDNDPTKPPGPTNVTTQVSIRNLKDNL